MISKRFKTTKGLYDRNFNPYVYKAIPRQCDCLDIGCWNGNLGERLILEKQCVVDGVDSQDEALRAAKTRGYRKVFKVDLNAEVDKLKKWRTEYDVIIFGDVLEHLIDPLAVLSSVRKLLRRDGLVVISVPNIGFIMMRALHLLGKFNYNSKGGIMDGSHLRFFTKDSLARMCLTSGYKVEKIEGYNLVKHRFLFLVPLAKIWPAMFALQILIQLRK
jgi:2-polyprenyl-3-methyl-5-hydroxy-6-metoxy-1,4-benzoquinol methylase